jgi:hypothetical protein
VVGGRGPSPGSQIHGDAELFDVGDGTFSAAASLTTARFNHQAVKLVGGDVLVVGGNSSNGQTPTAEIYSPGGNTFTPTTGDMSTGRVFHRVTALADGRALVTGGTTSGGKLSSAEIYTPGTGLFTEVGPMTVERESHAAVLLDSGKVLIMGGRTNAGVSNTAEIFDPSDDSLTAVGQTLDQYINLPVMVLLEDGTVLIAGGQGGVKPQLSYAKGLSTAYLFHPDSETFEQLPNMPRPMQAGSGVRLTSGHVFMVGDTFNTVNLAPAGQAIIYYPLAKTWDALWGGRGGVDGLMVEGRLGAPAALCADGVFVAGGVGGNGPASSAEVFTLSP